MMGLKDEIFYFSWFITYALQVSLLKILTLKNSVKKLEGSYSLKFCFPMRFGVILYSTKFIKKIESNSGELPLDPVENNSGTEEDVSSLILTHSRESMNTSEALSLSVMNVRG
ncbi:UDP-glucose:glycoprotein glucosyltransferase-like [Cornus florida]|uniref:UDP-glucose:glycoprotein glucosyltransferase-like n=1 Tax=Cornus florida TaxID=4283 RepID=UPI00289ACDF6|nr:UDP-glucose:glycoprotein glucosyltransferase-like [Cornus florida]